MLDPEAREEEAKEASKQIKFRAEEKFLGVDRHLAIHMSKGYITDEEIAKLATLHHIPEADIRERIRQSEEKKGSEIDQQLSVRMAKGYVTEDEIQKVAKALAVSADMVRKRVTCPIKKEAEAEPQKIKKLEPAIEKNIEDNLSIVGVPSLYDFLGLDPSSSLPLLQAKAKKKEAEVSKIAKKDAVVTASSILVGHCMSLFQSEESRRSYDVSRSRKALKALDADIDVAVMDGKIRAEYLETLVKTAGHFGLDDEEARRYIHNYCREKGWTIEGEEVKKKAKVVVPHKMVIAGVIAAVAFLVLAVAGGVWLIRAQRLAGQYEDILAKVEKEVKLDKKVTLLEHYIKSATQSKHTQDAQQRITELLEKMEITDLKDAEAQANPLARTSDFEGAAKYYEAFLAKHPSGPRSMRAKRVLDDLLARGDEKDFAALQNLIQATPEDRLDGYAKYVRKHGKSAHAEEVKKLIWNMSEEYYLAIKKRIAQHEAEEEWEACIGLCERYMGIYNNARSVELEKDRDKYRRNLQESQFFARLVEKADAMGANYEGARQVYKDYLQAYPDSSVKDKVEKRLAMIAELEEKARMDELKNKIRGLAAQTGRFREKHPDVLEDARTGRQWAILDSGLEQGKCMTYEDARKYVQNLRTGGYRDWRLPRADELKAIYKKEPFFPSWDDKWFWSSDNYKRFVDGKGEMSVEAVTNAKETNASKLTKSSWECGAVHAVRP